MGENIFELIFLPALDEKTLPLKPEVAVAKGAAKEINLLIGTNRDEGVLFFPLIRIFCLRARSTRF